MVTTTVSLSSTYTVCPHISSVTIPRRIMHLCKLHVWVMPLPLSALSSLPPKAKLLQVTIPMVVLTMVPGPLLGRLWPCLRAVLIHLVVRSSPFLLGTLSLSEQKSVKWVPKLIGFRKPHLLFVEVLSVVL